MNTKVRHTPGPWIEVDGFIYSEHTEGRPLITQLMTCFVSDDDNSLQFTECENIEANARLITAAPSLLEALEIVQRLRHLIEYPNDDIPMGHLNQAASLMIMLEKVDEAIKLAKGEL